MASLPCSSKRTPRHFTTSHEKNSAVHSLHTCLCPENVARGMNTLSPLSTQKAMITNVAQEKRYCTCFQKSLRPSFEAQQNLRQANIAYENAS